MSVSNLHDLGQIVSDYDRFCMVPHAVTFCPGLSDRGLRLFLVLMTYVNTARDGEAVAWPSRATLAQQMDRSVPSIDRAIADLVGAGLLKVTRRGGQGSGQRSRTSLYRLCKPPKVMRQK